MKKVALFYEICILILIVLPIHSLAADTHIGAAVKEGNKAASHGSASAAHAIVGSGQVTSATSAVPLSVAGSAGVVSTEIAKDLVEAATASPGTPLKITDETVTIGPPPDKALKSNIDPNSN